jgi:hypothetical protein
MVPFSRGMVDYRKKTHGTLSPDGRGFRIPLTLKKSGTLLPNVIINRDYLDIF